MVFPLSYGPGRKAARAVSPANHLLTNRKGQNVESFSSPPPRHRVNTSHLARIWLGHLRPEGRPSRCGSKAVARPRVVGRQATRVRLRFRCWRGETGKRDGIAIRWAQALVGSNPTASTAALCALDSASRRAYDEDGLRFRVASLPRQESRGGTAPRLSAWQPDRPDRYRRSGPERY